jgi:hypothetical protein
MAIAMPMVLRIISPLKSLLNNGGMMTIPREKPKRNLWMAVWAAIP